MKLTGCTNCQVGHVEAKYEWQTRWITPNACIFHWATFNQALAYLDMVRQHMRDGDKAQIVEYINGVESRLVREVY